MAVNASSTDANKALVRRAIGYNHGVADEATEIFAADFVAYMPGQPPMDRATMEHFIGDFAVTCLLRNRLPNVARQSGRSYKAVAGDPARSLAFAADIVVGSPPQLVIDTKYARAELTNQYGGWSFHNDHVYQVVFYALSLDCPALLVYPKVDRDIDVTFDIAGIPVSILTVGLAELGLPGLDALVERVADLTKTA